MQTLTFLRDNAAWLGAGGLMMFGSSFGQTYFISLFAGEIRAEFGLSHGDWGTIYAVGTMASAALMLTIGGVADGYRARALVTVNLAAFAVLCLALASAPSAWMLIPIVFGLRFCGQGMMSHLSVVSMGRWFAANRGKAISVSSMGFSLGEAVLPLIFVTLMGVLGWRGAWVVAALVLLAYIPIFLMLLRRERNPRGTAEADMTTGMLGRHWRRGDALGHWLFWAVMPGFLVAPAFGTAFLFQQVHLADTNDWTLEGFAALFPIYTTVSVISLFVTGTLIDRVGVGRVMPWFLLPMAAAFLTVGLGDTIIAAALGMTFLGMMQGASATVGGAFWPEYFGTRHLGSIRAMSVAVMVFASGVGPAATGILIDRGISFDTQLVWMAGIVVLASLVFLLALSRARHLLPSGA